MRIAAAILISTLGLTAASEAAAQVVLRSNSRSFRPMQRLQPNSILRLVRYERVTILYRGRTRVYCGPGRFPLVAGPSLAACRTAALDDRRRQTGAVRGAETGTVGDVGWDSIDVEWGGNYCFNSFDRIGFIDPPVTQQQRGPSAVQPVRSVTINGVAAPMRNGRAVWPAGVARTDGASYTVTLDRGVFSQSMTITLHRVDLPTGDPATLDAATADRLSATLEQRRCLAQLTWLGQRLPLN